MHLLLLKLAILTRFLLVVIPLAIQEPVLLVLVKVLVLLRFEVEKVGDAVDLQGGEGQTLLRGKGQR